MTTGLSSYLVLLKSVKVVKSASLKTDWTRRLSVDLSSVPERHRGWWRGTGERKIRSREIPDLACSGEMTRSLVTGVRAVDNKIKSTKGNNI